VTSAPDQTAAATAARRRQTRDKLVRVEKAIGQLRRERGRLTVRAIAERAGVSTTFLYENPEARVLVQAAVTDSKSRHVRVTQDEHERIEASWRERALNAEEQLTRFQAEIFAQRQRIGTLMGQLRDVEQMVPGESVQRLTTENTTLKRRVQQLSREHRTLQERLEGARSNLRFADKRIADLEAQILEVPSQPGPARGDTSARQIQQLAQATSPPIQGADPTEPNGALS
jgi:chromosome segregation ATPase